jgi:predicted LPLAT superfamily acyltransferase
VHPQPAGEGAFVPNGALAEPAFASRVRAANDAGPSAQERAGTGSESPAQDRSAGDAGGTSQKRAASDSESAAQKRAASDSGSAAQKRAAEWAVRPERSNTLALRFMAWVALHLGRAPARALLPPICVYFMLFAPKVREASREFLTHALGRAPTLRDYYLHIHTFACTILDRVFLLNNQFERFDVQVFGREMMDGMLERGEGCFLLGAHLGSFEVLRTLARVSKDLEVSLVMYENNARKVNEVLNAINPNLAMQVIGLGHPDAMLKVQEALAGGRFVGILGDRNFADEGVVPVTFFGRTTHCPIGPFRMAAMLGRPMVLMLGLYRGGNRYDIHFERLPDISSLPRGERAQAIERSLQNYVERLEHYCRLAPYNWFNYYAFWDQGKSAE